LSTAQDSARYYYQLGWQQIMDFGQYSAAETSYRKAMTFDENFLLNKSVLARLTTDLQERLDLFQDLEAYKAQIKGDERKVLDVYVALVNFTNIREQTPDLAKPALEKAMQLAHTNLYEIINKYPAEPYLKAEYIEMVHSMAGPQATLDSLDKYLPQATDNPFLLGFRAETEAELGNYKLALEKAAALEQLLANQAVPKPMAVYAAIYYKMDSLALAKKYVDQAYQLDDNNLDAARLKKRIEAAIKLKTNDQSQQ
jgi:hypothetical protein